MKIFDAQLRSDALSDEELRNLHYFETESVVTTAYAASPFERSRDIITYFEELVHSEPARLRRAGLVPHVALGMPWNARPRRSHPEVWRELPELLDRDVVVAVGECGAWLDDKQHWDLFDRHIGLAIDHDLPLIVTPPADLVVNMTYKMMRRLDERGMRPERCLMNRLDERLLGTVAADGFIAGLSVGFAHQRPRAAADLIARVLDETPAAVNHIVLNSAIRRGATDILGVPKTVTALTELGVAPEAVARVASTNAHELFVRTSA